MKKCFLVVLYKCKVCESATAISLKNNKIGSCDANEIFVWDNSPNIINSLEDCKDFFETKNVYFFHTPENTSLAIVYNTVISICSSADYIAIFDQDTMIKEENLDSTLNRAIENNKDINLFMPLIRTSSGAIYSPGKNILPGKNKKIKKISFGVCNCKNLVGITSGLVISTQYLKEQYKFNEELKLYGVDTDFFYHYTRKNKYLYLLNIDISHNLSFENENISEEENWLRFLERNTAYYKIYKTKREKIFVWLWIFIYKVMHKINILRYK